MRRQPLVGGGYGAPLTLLECHCYSHADLPQEHYMKCISIDPPQESDNSGVRKASIEILEDHYKELNSRKIKDSLSSFLPDIPGTCYCLKLCICYGTVHGCGVGEFDSIDSTETKLRHLLDQRVIGNKEFHPLSGHALLGFRLLPGPVS